MIVDPVCRLRLKYLLAIVSILNGKSKLAPYTLTSKNSNADGILKYNLKSQYEIIF